MILGPLNTIVLRKMLSYDKMIMRMRDERIKKLNEVLHGVQLIKLFAWEPQMAARVIEVRGEEVDAIKGTPHLSLFYYLYRPLTFNI